MWVAQLVPLQGEELGRGRGGLGAGKVGEETAVSVVGWWRGGGKSSHADSGGQEYDKRDA